jgi:hypothetical protein
VLPRSRDELIRGAAEDQWGYYVSSIIFNMNDPGDVALTEFLRSQRIIKHWSGLWAASEHMKSQPPALVWPLGSEVPASSIGLAAASEVPASSIGLAAGQQASDERRAWSIDQTLLLEPTIAYCRNRCVYSRMPRFSKTLLTTARQWFEAFATDNDA